MPKPTAFEPDVLFAALSDRTRLRLLCLMRAGEVCVCDLVDGVDAPQPTVSRHLAVLRRVGLVRVRRAGLWSHYSLAPAASNAKDRGELHRQLLACIDACASQGGEFDADAKRVERARTKRGACQ